MNIQLIIESITTMNMKGLLELNKMIVSRINKLKNEEDKKVRKKEIFKKGDVVKPRNPRENHDFGEGVISRIKITHAIVSFGDYGEWNVRLSSLKHVT